MRIILTLALIFTFILSYSQSEKIVTKINADSIFFKSCESGTNRAIEDAENGIYNYYKNVSTGVKTKEEWKFSEFYQKYLKSDYGILVKDRGCVVTSQSECYSKKMNELIEKKYGEDIFIRTREQAKKNFTV
jgi:hypothetical protein